VVNDSADVTSSGRSFHACGRHGPATGKARLPTVDSLLVGTTRRLVPTERSDRRLGRSATRAKGLNFKRRQKDVTLQGQERATITSHLCPSCHHAHSARNTWKPSISDAETLYVHAQTDHLQDDHDSA